MEHSAYHLSPLIYLSSTGSAIASGMRPLVQDRRKNLLEGRVLVILCFLHQINQRGIVRVSWVKKNREAVCRRHLQIPVFIKIDCGAHIKSTFLCFLPVLVHGGACTLSEHSSGAQEGEPGT